MFRNILVAVDGSSHSERALAEAADLARLADASLSVATVVPDPNTLALSGAGFAYAVDYEGLDRDLQREYRELLDGEVAKVPEGLKAEGVLLEGRAARAIVERVKAAGHDLVVIGSRGRSSLRSMVLGSVSQEVLHSSPVPVLVVHLPDDHA
jgi:nucleotide-binding universal stress UspA family protein